VENTKEMNYQKLDRYSIVTKDATRPFTLYKVEDSRFESSDAGL
jgi:hypothetical protein